MESRSVLTDWEAKYQAINWGLNQTVNRVLVWQVLNYNKNREYLENLDIQNTLSSLNMFCIIEIYLVFKNHTKSKLMFSRFSLIATILRMVWNSFFVGSLKFHYIYKFLQNPSNTCFGGNPCILFIILYWLDMIFYWFSN